MLCLPSQFASSNLSLARYSQLTSMKNYDSIRAICKQYSAFSRPVIDEFLMHYAATQEGLEKEMDRLFAPFRQVTKTFQPGWIGMIKAQYIAHRIFRKDGLIKKYLNHAAVKALKPAEQDYLKRQSEYPWRYSSALLPRTRRPIFTKWMMFSAGSPICFIRHRLPKPWQRSRFPYGSISLDSMVPAGKPSARSSASAALSRTIFSSLPRK